MIGPPSGVQIWIAAGLTDMRRGFTGLSAIVQTVLQQNPFSGHVFVFRGKRGDLIKLLWWDGDGLCLFAKRLERADSCGRKRKMAQLHSHVHSYRCCWRGSIGADQHARGRQKWQSEQQKQKSQKCFLTH
jgi:transposase